MKIRVKWLDVRTGEYWKSYTTEVYKLSHILEEIQASEYAEKIVCGRQYDNYMKFYNTNEYGDELDEIFVYFLDED